MAFPTTAAEARQDAEKAFTVLEDLGFKAFAHNPDPAGLWHEGAPHIGLVLGTGWGEAVPWDAPPQSVPFQDLPGFEALRDLEGHRRCVVFGEVDGKRAIALQGRVHLNEGADPRIVGMVRLQTELLLLAMGCTGTLILTAAVGSLSPKIPVGQIVTVDGFVTVFAPPMPLFGGEFCSPEDRLTADVRDTAKSVIEKVQGQARDAGHAMVRGPFFEGRRYDKALLANVSAGVVGMSMLPEACVAAAVAPDVKVLGLGYVTNGPQEVHSHDANQAQARSSVDEMRAVLRGVITHES